MNNLFLPKPEMSHLLPVAWHCERQISARQPLPKQWWYTAWLLRTRSYGGTESVCDTLTCWFWHGPLRCEWLRCYLHYPKWAAKCALQALTNGDRWRRRPCGRRCIRGWWVDSYWCVQHQRSPSISPPSRSPRFPCRHLAHAATNSQL